MADYNRLQRRLEAQGIPARLSVPLSGYTTFHIGGPAALLAEPDGTDGVRTALSLCRQEGARAFILGNGSNTLFSDDGFDGVVLHQCPAQANITVENDRLVCHAGALLAQACVEAAKAGLTGLEFAYGIPGSVGGAVYMNAGAYGGEMADVVESVLCILPDGTERIFSGQDLAFGYRTSAFQGVNGCIVQTVFALAPAPTAVVEAAMADYKTRRAAKQPLNLPSAGSVFKRPAQGYAAALIDECGLKGVRVGGAQVSEKHAGFIVNTGGATAADVIALADLVSDRVFAATGIRLERELRVVV